MSKIERLILIIITAINLILFTLKFKDLFCISLIIETLIIFFLSIKVVKIESK